MAQPTTPPNEYHNITTRDDLVSTETTLLFQFKMAGFLRGKQAGIQNDLSAGIPPGLFAPDDQARFGINSQIGYETSE